MKFAVPGTQPTPALALDAGAGQFDLSQLSITAMRGIGGAEVTFRDAILRQALDRISEGAGKAATTAQDVLAITQNWIKSNLGANTEQITSKAGSQAAEVGADTASLVLEQAAPIAAGSAFMQIRQAAHLAHTDPERRPEARARMLLGLADVSSFIYSVSGWSSPVGLIASTALTTGVKVANALYNTFRNDEYSVDKDVLLKTTARWAETPGISHTLDYLLRLTHRIDTNVVTGVNNLKDYFAPDASAQQRRHGQMLLDKFHTIYSAYYPEAQAEDRQAMRKYLADKNDTWDVHVIEKNGQVVGGFTCFHQTDKEFGKHLYIEQILPPYEQDPEGNRAAWAHIHAMAKQTGVSRIWLESPRSESLPDGFLELEVIHAQPRLAGRYTSAVPIDSADPKDQLRMSVLTVDPNANQPSYREYWKIITQGCTEPWADKADPAWQLLTQNPRDDSQMRFRLQNPTPAKAA